MAFYKTTNKDHRASIGVLADLIRKHGAQSSQVDAYMTRFQEDEEFCRKASLLISMGSIVKTKESGEKNDLDR